MAGGRPARTSDHWSSVAVYLSPNVVRRRAKTTKQRRRRGEKGINKSFAEARKDEAQTLAWLGNTPNRRPPPFQPRIQIGLLQGSSPPPLAGQPMLRFACRLCNCLSFFTFFYGRFILCIHGNGLNRAFTKFVRTTAGKNTACGPALPPRRQSSTGAQEIFPRPVTISSGRPRTPMTAASPQRIPPRST